MGIFGSTKEMDPAGGAVFASPPDHVGWRVKAARKAIARESAAILAATQGETLLVVAHDQSGMSGGAVVVTDQRAFSIKKGRVEKSLRHSEIAETRLGDMPNGQTLVGIESVASQQDYSPRDAMRFEKIIQVEVASPRIGNLICGHIDRIIEAS